MKSSSALPVSTDWLRVCKDALRNRTDLQPEQRRQTAQHGKNSLTTNNKDSGKGYFCYICKSYYKNIKKDD